MRYHRVLSAYYNSYLIPDPAGNCVKSVVNVALDRFAWAVNRAHLECTGRLQISRKSIVRVLLNDNPRIMIDYDTYYSINKNQNMQYEEVNHKRNDSSSFSIRRFDLVPNTGMIRLQRLPLTRLRRTVSTTHTDEIRPRS